jgi:hypothetical protein
LKSSRICSDQALALGARYSDTAATIAVTTSIRGTEARSSRPRLMPQACMTTISLSRIQRLMTISNAT